jgi:hypothetical protein
VLGLAGKVSRVIEAVIRARFSYTMPDGRIPWNVTKGDTGILRWKRHRRYARFVELLVVWDGDPTRKARRTVLASLEIIGLQLSQERILIYSR